LKSAEYRAAFLRTVSHLRAARWPLPLLAAALAVIGVLGVGALVPKRLPEPQVANRVLARPHRIAPGQAVAATHLLRRIERLGYRRTKSATPEIGEYFRGDGRIAIHRREFTGPQGVVPPLRFDLELDGDRVEEIVDAEGHERSEIWLDPETVGALADDAPVDRLLIGLADVPKHLLDALFVVEDRRFYEHHGIDLRRMAGALVANLRAGGVREGGSTITQQLVKNVFLSHERTLGRKLHEMWLALRVERAHSKDEILEAYLNTIYLGQRGAVSVIGIEAAARHYFGHSARTLSLAESALLVGMIRGPGYYSPWSHPDNARDRRNQVLAMMAEEKVITQRESQKTAKLPLGNVAKPPAVAAPRWFLAKIERDLAGELSGVDLSEDRVAVYTGLDAELQIIAESAVRAGVKDLEAGYPRVGKRSKSASPLQAALVAIEPATGAILAYVGGSRWSESQFDRVAQAHRQPGSAFKPIVLLAALSRRSDGQPAFTLASLLRDEPLEIDTPQGLWRPEDYEKEFRGPITLRHALQDSVNVPFARVGLAIGPETIVDVAHRMGIESPLEAVPSLALGAGEVSPLELARAYALLANGGERVAVRGAIHVTDPAGRVLHEESLSRVREFDPAEVALVTSALVGAVNHGTGYPLRQMGYRGPVAGKTGTTNEARDAWFVGFTPELVAAVWVGFDDGTPLGLTGAQAALPIFGRFLVGALGADGGEDFPEPPGLERVSINESTGLRASFFCWGEDEWFLAGTAPTESCGSDWESDERFEPHEPGAEPSARRPQRRDPVARFFERLFRGLADDERRR
jgi:penicillin-binding protein 1B